MRVDDNGAIVARMDERWIVAVLLHRPDHALELPRRRRAGGEEKMPGDVDLERRVRVLRDDVLITGGGIIPKEDVDALEARGIGRLFGPGTPTTELIAYIKEWFATREKQEA